MLPVQGVGKGAFGLRRGGGEFGPGGSFGGGSSRNTAAVREPGRFMS